jgi:hypothetical protein
LYSNPTIRKISALGLLLLFSFSITPKLILHRLIANHKDTAYSVSKEKKATLDKTGFNCHCEDLVVTLPFLPQPEPVYTTQLASTIIPYSEKVSGFLSLTQFFFELRGPPALA